MQEPIKSRAITFSKRTWSTEVGTLRLFIYKRDNKYGYKIKLGNTEELFQKEDYTEMQDAAMGGTLTALEILEALTNGKVTIYTGATRQPNYNQLIQLIAERYATK